MIGSPTTLLDRVAAAIAYEDIGRLGEFRSHAELWGELAEANRADYRRMAKGALSALQPETQD